MDESWGVCVNPGHLETGSHSDNTNDVFARNRYGAATISAQELTGVRMPHEKDGNGESLGNALNPEESLRYELRRLLFDRLPWNVALEEILHWQRHMWTRLTEQVETLISTVDRSERGKSTQEQVAEARRWQLAYEQLKALWEAEIGKKLPKGMP